MPFLVVIPVRFASTRLPGKALVDIAGQSMLQRVFERAVLSHAERVVIATDDERIRDTAVGFGAEVVMTDATHQSGTDRLQEAANRLGLSEDAVVVNVQGDEPMIPPAAIDQVAACLDNDPRAGIATLYEPISDSNVLFDPDVVKLVVDTTGRALYFSRAPIPWARDPFAADRETLPAGIPFLRHVGIYAYRVSFLHAFVRWPEATLERTERLEQLRALENGVSICAAQACETIPAGVDTEEDLQRVRRQLSIMGQS